jgi:hypothetical protein
MLTRKHFEIIAREIKEGEARMTLVDQRGYRQAVKSVTYALRQINPRFDADKFVAACTPEDNT